MNDTYTVVIATEGSAREKFLVAMAHAKAMLDNGEVVKLSVGPSDDPISVKQRGFLHASVLPQIAEQAFVGEKRERYVSEIWKEHFHRMFIPDRWEMRKLPGAKRTTPHRVRVSSEQLGVKRYSEWIDKIIDHAVSELGVNFEFQQSEREGVRYISKPRKENQQ